MFTELHCIALRTISYSDRYSILTAYSMEAGRVALLVPAGHGRTANRYRALTMPMALFECVADIKPGKEIYTFRDLKPDARFLQKDISHPIKNIIAFFLAEFYASLLREPQSDPAMFALIEDVARILWNNEGKGLANLHILALANTAKALGLQPDTTTWTEKARLDMDDGVWTRQIPDPRHHVLDTEMSETIYRIMSMDNDNFGEFSFNRMQRNEIVDIMLRFFSLHGFAKVSLTSVDVVKELF